MKTNAGLQGNVIINFKPVVRGATLDFTSHYQNDFGEDYTIRSFKFYIHQIELSSTANTITRVSDDYYLVDAEHSGSTTIALKALAGQYKSIAFTIGVDSTRNVSGAQTNALDPVNGMFWTWNSGYIMAKFEGVSPVSTQPGNRFEYHIGGFRGTENVVKRIVCTFPSARSLDVQLDKTATINITADANAWFKGNTALDIFSNPVCMTPGPLAKAFAENYYTMFTVTEVVNN